MATVTSGSPVTLPLTTPLQGHKGEIRELVFREPSARDYIELGLPFKQFKSPDGVESRVDMSGIARWASRLSDIEQGILATMNKSDWWLLIGLMAEWIGSGDGDSDEEKVAKN